ncbi:hypothetical protein [Lignipirellula cremea]|uniref:Uncharacterized protein n=1 Tax=Lignipirellula cremea TaxID=2528010 RepID=A0A518DXU9_9BACT|nr:hypothetical protein [Lignipirellula cremea]QDU96673.1 hypothetical protein Pla8534_44940 [Lignipirellula cremea]
MKSGILFLLATSLLGLGAGSACAETPGEKLAAEAVRNGHKTLAVVPAVVHASTDGDAAVGELGPRGKMLASALYDQLVEASQKGRYQGKFRVVSQRSMSVAMRSRGITVDNLSDPDQVRVLARDLEADEVIAVFRDEQINQEQEHIRRDSGQEEPVGPRAARVVSDHLDVESIDPEQNTALFTERVIEPRTLATAAYQGESWEIRRWQPGGFVNRGIRDGVEPFGIGPEWETLHYAALRSDLDHPYSAAGFPYRLDVYVGDEVREPRRLNTDFGSAYVVELNPGDVYKIGIRNDSERPVYVALYVDGLSVIDQKLVDPSDLEIRRHWMLPPQSGRRFVRGWYTVRRDEDGNPLETQLFDEFKVSNRKDSVAFGQGFEQNLGMITAVFYTVGLEDVQNPGPLNQVVARALPPSALGTGRGLRKEQQLDRVKAEPRGMILGAVTLYYRPAELISKPRDASGDSLILIPGF